MEPGLGLSGPQPPLRLWFFADGLYVVDALPPYEGLIGSRIDGLAGHGLADVTAAITPLVPRDNDQTVTLLMPRYLLIPEVLHGLGIIGQVGAVELAVTSPDGEAASVSVEPVPMAKYNQWAGAYGLPARRSAGGLPVADAGDPLVRAAAQQP